MKSKKLMITLSTVLILSTSAMPVFAHGRSYNGRFNYGYGQSYSDYGNGDSYGNDYDYGNSNGYDSTTDSTGDSTGDSNLGTEIDTIQTSSSETSTSTNSELKSEIKAEYAAISTTEKSNLKISKQILSKEAKIRNYVKLVKRGKIAYTSAQIAEITTLSTALQTDLQAVTTNSKKVQTDKAVVNRVMRRQNSQTILTALTTEETDQQTLGTDLTKANSDLTSILTVLGEQAVTNPDGSIQSVSAVNGEITVTLNNALAAAPAVTDFTVTQTIGSSVTTIVPTTVTMDSTNTIATLAVPTVEATTTGQSIVDSVSYKNTTPVSASAFEVSATTANASTTFSGVYKAGLLGLANYDTITVTDGTQVTGVTVNDNPLVSGTDYSISGNIVTVAVTAKTDIVKIQTTGGISNSVTIQ